jgi:hypothetical protein
MKRRARRRGEKEQVRLKKMEDVAYKRLDQDG